MEEVDNILKVLVGSDKRLDVFRCSVVSEGVVWNNVCDFQDHYPNQGYSFFYKDGTRYRVRLTEDKNGFIYGCDKDEGILMNFDRILIKKGTGLFDYLIESEIEILGMKDITDIQPHEYGILKLKYGIDRKHLWIPEILKPLAKALYKRG